VCGARDGGGGGSSRIFAQPWYQRGIVPPSLAGVHGGRDRVVPDVAMDADPYTGGLLVGETMTFPHHGGVHYIEAEEGGTSLASPLFAGVMAVADQAAGGPLGFANPLLYSVGGTFAYHDIVGPSHRIAAAATVFNNYFDASDGRDFQLAIANKDTSLRTRIGYDNVTGLGSPRGQAFLDAVS
jgi:subtilase family serine protease